MKEDATLYLMSPTSTRKLRNKPQDNWAEKLTVSPGTDSRGHPTGKNIIKIDLQEGLVAVVQTTLPSNESSGREVALKLGLSAKRLGWSAFDEKMFDLCVLFADRHPDSNGAFVYNPVDFGKFLFPQRERLSVKDYHKMHRAITKLATQRYKFTLSEKYGLRDFRIIADFGEVTKRVIGPRKSKLEEVYAGGFFQIFGTIWKDIMQWRYLAPIEVKSLGLPDKLYPINRAIKYYARINWNKGISDTHICRMKLKTLIDWTNIAISPNHEKRKIERLHGYIDQLVEEGMYADWWIEEARSRKRIPKIWYEKTRLVAKKPGENGGYEYTTRWERMDKIYCFVLSADYVEYCQSNRKNKFPKGR